MPKLATDDELFQMSISAGDNFANYENIPVEVVGDNVPAPVKDFLCLRPLVLDNVKKSKYSVSFNLFHEGKRNVDVNNVCKSHPITLHKSLSIQKCYSC